MDVIKKSGVIKLVQEATRKAEGLTTPSGKPDLNQRDTAILKTLDDADFGCNRDDVVSLMTALTGTDFRSLVSLAKDDVLFNSFEAIVPLSKFRHHNYPLNVMAVAIKSGEQKGLIQVDGKVGNNVGHGGAGSFRFATNDEIAAITDVQLTEVANNIVFIPAV